MQSADFFVFFANLFVYIRKKLYLCTRLGCRGVTHVHAYVSKSMIQIYADLLMGRGLEGINTY